MDKSTNAIAHYIADKGITVKHLSEVTGIPYSVLHNSLSPNKNNRRSLRGDELIALCQTLEINPMSLTA